MYVPTHKANKANSNSNYSNSNNSFCPFRNPSVTQRCGNEGCQIYRLSLTRKTSADVHVRLRQKKEHVALAVQSSECKFPCGVFTVSHNGVSSWQLHGGRMLAHSTTTD